MTRDTGHELYDAVSMDAKAIRRAALVTLPGAILERFADLK